MRAYLATLCGILLVSPLARAAEDVMEYLSRDWYYTEVIVFQRPGAMEHTAVEELVVAKPRVFPASMRSFVLPPDQVGADYPLDDLTRATLEFPTLERATPAAEFLYLTPAESRRMPGQEPVDAQPTAPVGDPLLEPDLFVEDPMVQFLADLETFEAELAAASLTWLPETSLTLRRERNRLDRREDLRVLLHGRWLQPVPAREAPEPLLIQAGAPLDHTRQLEGTLSVTLGRYLHFRARLAYTEPGLGARPVALPVAAGVPETPPQVAAPPLQFMVMDESRRMRSEELNYLDHPKLGVLVKIDPVELPERLVAAFEALKKADEQR